MSSYPLPESGIFPLRWLFDRPADEAKSWMIALKAAGWRLDSMSECYLSPEKWGFRNQPQEESHATEEAAQVQARQE